MRTIIRGFLLTLLVGLLSSPVWATTYYVSPGASGSGCSPTDSSGTNHSTINAGISCLNAGDTLVIHGGTYAEVMINRTGSNWTSGLITVKAAPGETVIVPHLEFSCNPCYVEVQRLIVDCGTGSSTTCIQGGSATFYRMRDVESRGGGQGYLMGGGAHDLEIIGFHSHHHGINTSGTITCPSGQEGQCHGLYGHGYNLLIEGGDFHHNNGYGIQFRTGDPDHDVTIRGNRFHHNTGGGIIAFTGTYDFYNNVSYSNDTGVWVVNGGSKVYQNTVYGNTGSQGGIYVRGDHGNVDIRNNIALNNPSGNIKVESGASGVTQGFNLTTGSMGFQDPNAADFRLTAEDNGGQFLGSPYLKDFLNVDRSNPPDRGAYEFGAPSPAAPAFTFTAASPVASGSPSTLTWSAVTGTGVTCVPTVPLGGPDTNWTTTTSPQLLAGGSKASAAITGPRTFQMECTNSSGVTTRTAAVTVAYSATPGVLVTYTAEAGTGTLVSDTAGAALVHHCTLTSAGWGPGIVGNFALSFNGARVCNGAAAADLRTPNQLGIALWMSSTGGSYQHLVSYASPTTGWGLWVGPDGSLHGYANLSNGFAAIATSGVDLRTAPPHHVGLTKDATTMQLWVDNVVVATLSTTDPIRYSGTEALEIGASCGSTGSCDWYTGLIDQVYLGNVAFTPAQMNGYYQERSGAIPPDFNFTATSPVPSNTPSTLSWSWNGPTTQVSCTPSMIAPGVDANWTTTAPATLLTTGSTVGVNLTSPVTYRLRCTHSGTNLSTTVDRTVTVGAPGAEVMAWYHADGTANDSGSHGFHGILTNGALASGAPIVSGNSFVFDGDNDYVQVPGNATLRPPAIGMTLWMNAATPPIDEGCHAIRMGNGYALGWEQDGRVFCNINNGPTTTSTVSILTGTNQMLSCGYDPASGAGIQLWIGQTPVTPSTVTSVAITYSGSEDLTIGGNPSGGYNCAGRMDDVTLVNYAWTQSDIDTRFGGASSSAGLSQTHSQYTVAHSAEGNWLGERDTDQVTLLTTPWGLRWSLHNASGATVAEHIRPFCRVNHLGTWGDWTELANSFGSFGLRYLTDSAVNLGTPTTALLPLDGFIGVPGIFLADTVDVTSPYDAAQQLSIPNGRQADQELRLEASSPPLMGGDLVQCQPRQQSGALLSGGYGVGDVNIRTLTLQGLGDAISVQQGGVHQGGTTQ